MTQSAVVNRKTYDERDNINDYETNKAVTFTDNTERVARPDTRGFQDVSMFSSNMADPNQHFVRIKNHSQEPDSPILRSIPKTSH